MESMPPCRFRLSAVGGRTLLHEKITDNVVVRAAYRVGAARISISKALGSDGRAGNAHQAGQNLLGKAQKLEDTARLGRVCLGIPGQRQVNVDYERETYLDNLVAAL